MFPLTPARIAASSYGGGASKSSFRARSPVDPRRCSSMSNRDNNVLCASNKGPELFGISFFLATSGDALTARPRHARPVAIVPDCLGPNKVRLFRSASHSFSNSEKVEKLLCRATQWVHIYG